MEDNAPVTRSTPDGDPIQDNPGAAKASLDEVGPDKVSPPARPKGPNASAIVVGLVAMALAGLFIAKETMDWRVDWSRLGPGAIVGIGVVMAVIGAIGLIRRHDDA